jgi:ABC-2 type transport system ATP-binding protein
MESRQQAPLAHTSSPVITVSHVSKTYSFHRQEPGLRGAIRAVMKRQSETRVAVDDVSFTIAPGEVVGLLGPNGAGKTTTLKMLTGLLHPSGGTITVLGHEPFRRHASFLRRIALVMGQKSMLWWDVPGMETMLLHKEMYGIPDATFTASVEELATMLDLHDLLRVPVRKLSLGERMKMELMAALLHRPDVLFLDEPTIGLDVVAKARVRGFLAEVNRSRGTTIIITSHDMDDIEALCERVMIIDHGHLGWDGSLSDLVREAQPRKRIRAVYAGPVDVLHLPAEVEIIGQVGDGAGGAEVSLEVARERLPGVLEVVPRLGPLVDLEITEADVEEIIRDIFSRPAATVVQS